MQVYLGNSLADYRNFLRIKTLPAYKISGRVATFPDEYAHLLEGQPKQKKAKRYASPEWMFDYQSPITELAIRRGKLCVFADCGLGKTPIFLEFARYTAKQERTRPILIVSPLMVIKQTMAEAAKFFGDNLAMERVPAADLPTWLKVGRGIGITNYEAIREGLDASRLGGLILDESSLLKSHYGKWGTKLIEMGRGVKWKMACTGTPAPNDRIEYANHAVFMDAFPNVNSFLARYFINRGQTQERWELKPHALKPFYRSLSAWSIFLVDPATYGWKDNAGGPPPIHVHVEDVELSDEQKQIARSHGQSLFFGDMGGIVGRSTMGQLAKGKYKGKAVDSLKPQHVAAQAKQLASAGEFVIVWCKYNGEQDELARLLPDAHSIAGDTSLIEREKYIAAFQSGESRILISKPKILGFGLNLQVCTRMIFSGLEDSYESFYQAVKRANRYGSTKPLHVHIPVTELERPMVDNVLRKAAMVKRDTEQQEKIFKEAGLGVL